MKEDIKFDPVEGVTVAVVPEEAAATEEGKQGWLVYLINHNDYALQNVIVNSHGYGTQPDGEAVKTSTLRHVFAEVEARSAVPVEPIDPALFHLNNQYWVSYYRDAQIFDKKFIFVPDSIVPANLTPITLLGRDGVLHV
ncbi:MULTISPECIES: hypothetical protein [Hymenobacter]|jgi:hypothetical protein|uniref:Uncharacterized protein n=1 Tax=Hymenobacter yonginensis TaxID=748197 RepID=A0ABY7PMH2_9BACT|nr:MULTISPECIES: hypothetical protein [Hymenobacter]AII51669.1 hypothetical protein N008_06685 [Hymenobacter sp. APR13]WBO84418.1 hypothetical protein O9Z63_18870 [Hymenobacter yonginensis]